MKVEDVPQENGMIGEHGHEISYAVDGKGRYQMVKSVGWVPKNIVNQKAWERIFKEIESVYHKVALDKLSPLAFHMAANQMDTGLLSKYVSIAGWRVKRHLKPGVFRRLEPSILEKYARLFEISIDELKTIPDKLDFNAVKTRKR